MEDKYGIYLHIPFCLRKCPYCDFYSLKADETLRKEYISALENQIMSFAPVEADTIYFGGGTPSLLEPDEMKEILSCIKSHHQISETAEVSMELNPATADLSKMKGFHSAGINRLSIGCQSFNDEILKKLGRLHDSAQAKETVNNAFKAGFTNVSVDLMLAVPGQTPEAAKKDAITASSLGVTHVSAYLLKICEGTPFADGVEGLPDDDTAADCYKIFCDTLEVNGYERYEISNFSKQGYESRHNLKYWNCGKWLGFGPASHMSDGIERYSSQPDIRKFIEIYKNGPVPCPVSHMKHEGTVDAEEYIITSMRLSEGMDLNDLKNKYGRTFSKEKLNFLEKLKEAGYINLHENRVFFTTEGILVSNSILSELI